MVKKEEIRCFLSFSIKLCYMEKGLLLSKTAFEIISNHDFCFPYAQIEAFQSSCTCDTLRCEPVGGRVFW